MRQRNRSYDISNESSTRGPPVLNICPLPRGGNCSWRALVISPYTYQTEIYYTRMNYICIIYSRTRFGSVWSTKWRFQMGQQRGHLSPRGHVASMSLSAGGSLCEFPDGNECRGESKHIGAPIQLITHGRCDTRRLNGTLSNSAVSGVQEYPGILFGHVLNEQVRKVDCIRLHNGIQPLLGSPWTGSHPGERSMIQMFQASRSGGGDLLGVMAVRSWGLLGPSSDSCPTTTRALQRRRLEVHRSSGTLDVAACRRNEKRVHVDWRRHEKHEQACGRGAGIGCHGAWLPCAGSNGPWQGH